MTNKKAQSGFILRVFSIIAYIIVLAMVVLLLRIPGCNSGEKAEEIIDSYSPEILELTANEQLISYLRTPLPGDIMGRIAWVEEEASKDQSISIFLDGLRLKWEGLPNSGELSSAKGFLESNPEVYVDRSYAEFLVALHPRMGSASAQDAFDVVTKLTFLQRLNEKRGHLAPDEIYFSPRICVSYPENEDDCVCEYTLSSNKPNKCSLKSERADPRDTAWDDYFNIKSNEIYVAKATIPLPDAKNPTNVYLDFPAEKIYMRIPDV